MKLLVIDCSGCRERLTTGYKNAYCIDRRVKPLACRTCQAETPAGPAQLLYYKLCARPGCRRATYRVRVSVGRDLEVLDKQIDKSACGCAPVGR